VSSVRTCSGTLEVDVVPGDAALLVAVARDDHDARAAAAFALRRLAHARPQQRAQRKVAEVVGCPVALVAIGRERALRDGHHARVEHQHIAWPVAPALGEISYRAQLGKVQLLRLDGAAARRCSDVSGSRLALGWIAHGEHNIGAEPGEARRGRKAEPAVASSDDDRLASH